MDVLMQIQTDILDVDVTRQKNVELTAKGAAMLAAHAVGARQITAVTNNNRGKSKQFF